MQNGPTGRWSVPRRNQQRGEGQIQSQGHRAGTGLGSAGFVLQDTVPAHTDVTPGAAGLNRAAQGTAGIQHQDTAPGAGAGMGLG